MSDQIIIAAVGQVSDGATVETWGVSTAAYHDPEIGPTLVRGTFHPIIDPTATLSWSEEISFQPQGGSTSVQVSDIPLINTGAIFDEWARATVAGLTWTLKRGRPDQPWSEWELIFAAVGQGSPEFEGRERVLIRLRDRFAALSQPVSQEVFGEDTPNERYINRLAPRVYGDVYQVGAEVIDPPFFRVFASTDLAVVRKVAEGGRPTTGWIDVENGYQMTQSAVGETLPITADIGGPPKPNAELRNLLEDIGGFSAWVAGDPDGFVVTETPPDSEISEDTLNGGALVKSTLGSSTGGDDLNAGAAQRGTVSVGRSLVGRDASDAVVPDPADWPALLNTDDAARVVATLGGGSLTSPRLTLTNFGAALGASAGITGLSVSVRAQKTGAGSGSVQFSEVRLLLPNGSVSQDKSAATAVTGTKTLYTFGGAADAWGLTLTPGLLNDPGLGLRLAFSTASTGSFPVSVEVFEVVLTAHTGTGSQTLKLYVDLGLIAGDRYRIRIAHDDLGAGDAISAKWAGVETTTSPIPDLVRVPGSTGAIEAVSQNLTDPNVLTTGTMEGAGELEGEFIADGPVLGIEFFIQPGQTGLMRLTRIDLDEISISINRIKDLVRAILSDAGFDPDADIDNASLDAIAVATGNPPLGWYIRNQTGRDQLLAVVLQSLASVGWGSIDGLWRAVMMKLPAQPEGAFLRFGPERNAGPSLSVMDEAPDLRDRVFAAQNVDPIRPSETAGITETWPETERQKVLTDWRITERVDFDAIAAGEGWPITPP